MKTERRDNAERDKARRRIVSSLEENHRAGAENVGVRGEGCGGEG